MAKLNLKSHKNKIKQNSVTGTIFYACICAVLILFTIVLSFVICWTLLNSLKDGFDLEDGNYFGLPNLSAYPNHGIFDNFINILLNFKIRVGLQTYYSSIFGEIVCPAKEVSYLEMLGYTLIYAGVGALFQAVLPAIVAFMLCKYRFKVSKIIYAIALVVYIIPIVGNYPAMITLMRDLGIYNTLHGSLIQKFNFFGMYFFVFYAYFENYSDSYLEAAEIDGASQLNCLTRIALPMASKLIATVFLISFVNLWNDYQSPLLYMPSYPTLAYAIYVLCTTSGNNISIVVTSSMKFAGVICTSLPIVLLFIFLKDKLMTNLSLGGVKE